MNECAAIMLRFPGTSYQEILQWSDTERRWFYERCIEMREAEEDQVRKIEGAQASAARKH